MTNFDHIKLLTVVLFALFSVPNQSNSSDCRTYTIQTIKHEYPFHFIWYQTLYIVLNVLVIRDSHNSFSIKILRDERPTGPNCTPPHLRCVGTLDTLHQQVTTWLAVLKESEGVWTGVLRRVCGFFAIPAGETRICRSWNTGFIDSVMFANRNKLRISL